MIIDPDLLLRLKNPKALAQQTTFNQWLLFISQNREVGITPWRDPARDMPVVASIPFDIDAKALGLWLNDPKVDAQLERIWQASQTTEGYEATIQLRRVVERMLDDVSTLTLVETDELVERAHGLFATSQARTLDGLAEDALTECLGPLEFNPIPAFPFGSGIQELCSALGAALVDHIAEGQPVSRTLWEEGLFQALRYNNLKALKVVLDWKVKVNIRDQNKLAPLNVARSKEAVWMLLDRGAKHTFLRLPLADHTIEWVMEWNSQKDLEALNKAVLTDDNKPYIKRKL